MSSLGCMRSTGPGAYEQFGLYEEYGAMYI